MTKEELSELQSELLTKKRQLSEANDSLNSILESQLRGYEYENGISGQRQKASNIEIKSLRELINSLESDISKIANKINSSTKAMRVSVRRR